MLKMPKLFSTKKQINESNLVKPDLYTHRKSPLESLKAKKLAEDAINDTETLINEFGPRITGSEACKACGEKISERLDDFCDFTSKQSFNHKGKAFSLWLKILPYVYVVSLILLLFGFSLLPLLLNMFFAYYVYREFIIYKPLFEKGVKTTNAINIHGVIEPEEEVEQTIIFSAHHDSAQLLNYNRGERGHFFNVELPLILFGAAFIVNIVDILVELLTKKIFTLGFPTITTVIFIVLLLIASPIVFKIKNYYSDKGSPGAGDNLISSNILIQLSKYFNWKKSNNKGLKNTRLIFTSFDAEEVGVRGSSLWFDKHQALLINPMQLNFDCIYNAEDLVFIDSDINGLSPLSKELAQKCVKLANDMGFEAKNHPLPFLSGATDAASGARANVDSCTLMAIDFSNGIKNSYFHTSKDTADKIEPKAVEKAISIAIKLANNVDKDTNDEDQSLIVVEDEKEEDIEDLLKFNKIARR